MILGIPSQSIIAQMSTTALGAVLSWGAIWLALPLLRRMALAQPVARSSHRIPTPQGAGMAIVLAAALCLAILAFSHAITAGWNGHVALLALALLTMAIVGGADDVQGLSVRIRLAAQAASAAAVVASLPDGIAIFSAAWLPLERILEAGFLLTTMNLVNFVDGLDEITVAHAVPALAGIAAIASTHALPVWILPLSTAACGGLIGFWPWNRHVAKVFLGDSGSLPLGLLLGYLLVVLAGSGFFAAAFLLCLCPLSDGAWTLFDRFRRGEKLTEGHRDHCYQRATKRGLGVRTVSHSVFGLCCLLALLAQTVGATAPLWQQAAFALLGLALTAALLRWLAAGWGGSR